MAGATRRRPLHAGSWYDADGGVLASQLSGFLQAATAVPDPVRALIVPHAGYSYSGRAAAYGYKCIQPQGTKRCFLLGPSHHWYLRKCALSTATTYETPVGDITVDEQIYAELRATGHFEQMTLDIDEAEHSLEMHLPYIRTMFGKAPVKLVPILVGSLSPESEALYGRILAQYMDDPANLFVISSDFCHWGRRFNYMPFAKDGGDIFRSIEALDKQGMALVEAQSPAEFTAYLAKYENTICGRHPIGVFLNVLQHCSTRFNVKFVRYEQSSSVRSSADSSVSYASAVVTVA